MAMLNHPNCNGDHPGREARQGPYTFDQCHLCWQAINEPERVARLRSGVSAKATPCKPLTAVPRDAWPLWARAVALMRKDPDRGVGDTLQRLFAAGGGERWKAWYKARHGVSCGCAARQVDFNIQYPYS